MGLLPFDDWIYHLPYKRDEVNREHQEVVDTQNTVQSRVLLFNKQLDQYKLLLTNNAVLLYIDKTVKMNDLELKDFTTKIDALEPPVKGDVVLNALSTTSELIGGVLVLKFIVNIGKIVKDAIWTSSEATEGVTDDVLDDMIEGTLNAGIVDASEAGTAESLEATGEEVTEAVVESSTSAALASTGIGIFLAVGIDIIFAAINGKKEADALDEALSKLKDKMKIVNGYLTTVNNKSTELTNKSVSQIKTFKDVTAGMTALLPPGHKPTFNASFPDTIESLDKCVAAQQAAIAQFSLLAQLRTTYVNAVNNHRNPSKAGCIGAVLLSAPQWVTEDILNSIWDNVLAKYSTLMRYAK